MQIARYTPLNNNIILHVVLYQLNNFNKTKRKHLSLLISPSCYRNWDKFDQNTIEINLCTQFQDIKETSTNLIKTKHKNQSSIIQQFDQNLTYKSISTYYSKLLQKRTQLDRNKTEIQFHLLLQDITRYHRNLPQFVSFLQNYLLKC